MTKQEAREAFFNNDNLSQDLKLQLWNLAEIYFSKPKPKKYEPEDVNYQKLLSMLQSVLETTYGKKQVKGFGNVYFLPTSKEIEAFLVRFWKQYPKYTNIAKIESILCSFVRKCAKTNKFAPAVKYFIGKSTNDGYVSQLASAYENYEEEIKNIIKEEKSNNSEVSL